MKIHEIGLKNFRCFEDFKLDIPDDYAVILGDNGTGKTAILEGMVIALGTILVSMDGVSSVGIKDKDIRKKYYELGSIGDLQSQYPVAVSSMMTIDDNKFDFSRSVNKPKGNITRIDAKNIMDHFSQINNKVKEGSQETVLPLISYYSTGRLWLHSKSIRKVRRNKNEIDLNDDRNRYRFNRYNGYVDCLSTKTNEKLMLKWFENMEYISYQRKKSLPELEVVKRAVLSFFRNSLDYDTDLNDFDMEFDPVLGQLVINYPEYSGLMTKRPFSLLSDGYRSTLSMVADIAYRMATLNPQLLEDALTRTAGVVLVDEIDMHLHPKWQRHVIDDLRKTFPGIQFIFTTHSEHIISNVDQENVIKLGELGDVISLPPIKGRDMNSIILEVMGLPVREPDAQELINLFYDLLDDGKLEEAKKILEDMVDRFGENDGEVIKATVELSLEAEL